jgi:hypothetical protein
MQIFIPLDGRYLYKVIGNVELFATRASNYGFVGGNSPKEAYLKWCEYGRYWASVFRLVKVGG